MTGHSLRTRLVATVLLLLAIASTVVAVVTTISLRGFLVHRLDADLRVASRVLIRAEPGSSPRLMPPGPGPRPPDSLTAVIHDGAVAAAAVFPLGGGQRDVPVDEYGDLAALPVGARPQSVDLGPLGDYRVVASRLPTGDVVVSGLPEAPVQDTVTRLVLIELVVAGVTLAGAGVAGAVVVRRELRPLERVAATAARVSALPLGRGEVSLVERVSDVDPRTEVGQVGTALNRMLDNVGSALEARHASEVQLRQFIADASHELRTPLAAISGYAELTRRGELPEDAAYSLTRITSQAERMTALVEDLLLLARLDAGRPLAHGEADLTRLVVDAVADAHAAGPDHHWHLAVPDDPVVVPGDGARLAQVLANLLANARTHTPAGTAVTVSLTAEPGGARLSVVDDGPGIAPDLLPHVFERFARGSPSRSRDDGSTGLGLAIVRAVVAAHDGSVDVAGRPGRTEFTVRLPRP
ncbi:MAG TPA: HAMP domain-containing sensor histidine kinase [Pseudonocardia sp.]|nr:HAMP domain-containing sensor histidine kinase [Pseudonocardia sp.]